MSVSRCHRLKKTLFCESFKWSSFAKTLIQFCKMLHNFVVNFRATRNGVCALHSDTCSPLHLAQVVISRSLCCVIVANQPDVILLWQINQMLYKCGKSTRWLQPIALKIWNPWAKVFFNSCVNAFELFTADNLICHFSLRKFDMFP